MNLPENIKQFIQSKRLLMKGDTLIVGVSGGADSVCLIRILNTLKHDLAIKLIIAHYNHKLRASANIDQKFVHSLATDLNLPFITENCKTSLKKQKGSLEDLAREARMDFLIRTAKKNKTNKIVLAHHQNDLAETVLMKLLRGTGLQGMRGILPIKKMNSCIFVRPLLSTSRKQIEQYLQKYSFKFRNDPTNQSTLFFRNKIRLDLLPFLKKKYNKNIQQVLNNFAENTAIDYDFILEIAQKELSSLLKLSKNGVRLSVTSLLKKHTAIQRQILRLIIEQLTGNTNQLNLQHIKEIEDLLTNRPINSIVFLPKSIAVKKDATDLIFTKN